MIIGSVNAGSFIGSGRFEVQGTLGSGAFGIVYQVRDRERDAVVALKLLHKADAAEIYRFKHEFRALADISHANLVTLYELLADGDQLFFTMELIEGVSFHEYTTSIERLRAALKQLAEGVNALHQAGKLHCDIKPSNVLVTEVGRVILLDFGLITEMAKQPEAEGGEIWGTPDFMAPEQVFGLPLSPACDWYSVGVMLYQALTGELPFDSAWGNILFQKQRHEPPQPKSINAGLPDDLNDLCVQLLRKDPQQRPNGQEILQRLGAAVDDSPLSLPASTRNLPLIGRERQLAALHNAYQASRAGNMVTVYLHGPSGMGKSILVKSFLQELQSAQAELMVLSGRCYEQESVPYKAFDGIVDELSQVLKNLPAREAEQLLPADILALTRLFPVLQQVPVVSSAQRRVLDIPDSQELRRRAFTAFKELLTCLSTTRSVLIFIDDLQWGDLDSAALLSELLRPPDAPALLFIAAYRSEEAETSPFLRALLPLWHAANGAAREIQVSELSVAEATELALALLDDNDPLAPERAHSIAQESGGSPFFIDELARYAQPAANITAAGLDEVIQARANRLPESARRLLEVIAVAGQPLPRIVARNAAALESDEQSMLAILRTGSLVRIRGTRAHDEVETYHDRIRESVVAYLPPATLQLHYKNLALAMTAHGQPDPEILARYYRGAGEHDQAAQYSMAAAERAAAALAFDRAAQFYRLALELHAGNSDEQGTLRIKLGAALANAGRGAEAAAQYLQAAQTTSGAQTIKLQQRAAEQLLRAGHIDEGLEALRQLLSKIGIKMASTGWRTIVSLLIRRMQISWQGFKFQARAPQEIGDEELIRIDTCWSVATVMAMVDNVRGADFQARHLLLALKAGEPYRIARALAWEIAYCAIPGGRARKRTQAVQKECRSLCEKINHPHAQGLEILMNGMAAFLEGRWQEASDLAERSEGVFRARCTGVAWELDTAQLFSLRALFYLGRLDKSRERLPALLNESRERGDLYAEISLRTRVLYINQLAQDEPEQARQELQRSIKQWSRHGYHLQHYFAFIGAAEVELYSGDGDRAWRLIEDGWSVLMRSRYLDVQCLFIESLQLRARAALAVAARAPQPRAFINSAEKDARRIARENMDYGNALALLIRAALAHLRGDKKPALEMLLCAEKNCQAAAMELYAAAARYRRGELMGGAAGQELIDDAGDWMSRHKIANPTRMVAMLAPGFLN